MPWWLWVIYGVIALGLGAFMQASGLREKATREAFEKYRQEREEREEQADPETPPER